MVMVYTNIHKILLTISLIIIGTCQAQSLDKLDENNGFKDFKFGDDLERWKNDLANIRVDSNYYYGEYTGNCCWTAFYKELEHIGLRFNKEKKLDQIIAWYRNPSNDILTTLEPIFNAFGDNTHGGEVNDQSMDLQAVWLTKNNVLLIVNFKYLMSYAWEVSFLIEKLTDETKREFLDIDF